MKPKLIINEYGTKYWFLNGKRHREDGPAIIYNDGTKIWILNNKYYFEKEWFNMILSRYLNEA